MILEKTDEELLPVEIGAVPPDLEAHLGRGTYKTIAERSGLSPRHVSRILNGQVRKPGLETIQKISQASGIDLDVLAEYIQGKRISRKKNQYSSSKLSQSQVEEIRKMKGSCTTRSAAQKMQVSRTTISTIWANTDIKR